MARGGWEIFCRLMGCALAVGWAGAASAAQTVRVVAYNIEADVDNVTTPRSGLYAVLEAIGENYVGGAAHPLDILALEETTSNTATVAPIVTALNSYYGGTSYAQSSVQGTENGGDPSTGNGPNAVLYNKATLTLLASVGIGTPTGSGNGEYRQVMRYEFQPVGGATGTQFYVYVCHMKSSSSGSDTTDARYRGEEAVIIENDIKTLSANGGVLCMGDFNMDGSTEAGYKTLTAAGAYQLIDPINPTDKLTETWDTNTYLLTESATSLSYRDDIQFMSAAVYNGTSTTGLHYVSGSYNVFGNNGTPSTGDSVNESSNTSLNGLQGSITPATALKDLTTASDHLPVVCDYTVVSPTSTPTPTPTPTATPTPTPTPPPTPTPAPYAAWQSQYFTSAELANSSISGDNADPDHDGIPNLLEYALGLAPRTPNATGLPVMGSTVISGSEYLTLTYTQVIADTDITYVPQVSGDLSTWTSGANAVATVSATNNTDGTTRTIVVRDLTAASSASERFIRLEITRP